MRRTLSCVLMMTLLLAGCAAPGGEENAEQLAARIRGEYLALSGWTASMDVTADYGSRVYEFSLDAAWERDGDTRLTITAPEILSGITARISAGEGYLEYDGASLSTGPLTGDGLSPMEAVPFFMEQLTEGCVERCAFSGEGEDRVFAVSFRDPEREEGLGTGCCLYFRPDTHDLLGMELSDDGTVVLTAVMTDFTKEMTTSEQEHDADLG